MKAGKSSVRWIMLMVFGALVALPGEPAGAAETTVVLKDVKFNPAGVTIAPGDTVVWKNEDTDSHSVTFDDGSFDSHPQCVRDLLLGPVNCMDPGDTVQHTFDKPGQHKYKCKLHGSMTGNVLVKESAAVTTVTTTATTQAPTTVTTIATTTTTRKLATSSTLASTTTSTVPAETTTTLTPNEAPAFDPGDGGDGESGAPASSDGGGGGGSGTVALIVAVLLAVAGGGGVLLWRLRPRSAQP